MNNQIAPNKAPNCDSPNSRHSSVYCALCGCNLEIDELMFGYRSVKQQKLCYSYNHNNRSYNIICAVCGVVSYQQTNIIILGKLGYGVHKNIYHKKMLVPNIRIFKKFNNHETDDNTAVINRYLNNHKFRTLIVEVWPPPTPLFVVTKNSRTCRTPSINKATVSEYNGTVIVVHNNYEVITYIHVDKEYIELGDGTKLGIDDPSSLNRVVNILRDLTS